MIFPVSIVIGYGIGYLLDKWFGTTSLKIVFLLFDVAAASFCIPDEFIRLRTNHKIVTHH